MREDSALTLGGTGKPGTEDAGKSSFLQQHNSSTRQTTDSSCLKGVKPFQLPALCSLGDGLFAMLAQGMLIPPAAFPASAQ